ncbi:MAG: VWA domain-containing protein [Vicinamibacterales bacterium]
MSLLSPLFLIGGLAAAVPILLHLLKRHPDAAVMFSAVRLLRDAPVEQASRRHLRELLLLALRVAALLCCAVAFARPYFAAPAGEGGAALAVALDTSFSMSGRGRFERARAMAVDAIDRAEPGTAIAVVAFNDTAEVVSGLSTDRALARAAVAGLRPTAGGTRYRAVLSTAAELLRGRTGALVVVTDLQSRGWEASDRAVWPASLDIRVADIGPPTDNLAITAALATADRIVSTVRNFSEKDVDARLHLDVGGTADMQRGMPAGDLRVRVSAGQSAQVGFPRPQGRWAVVRVADGEGAEADNNRYVLLEGVSQPRVLVVTASGELSHEAFYVEQALTASAAGKPAAYAVVGAAASTLGGWDEAKLEAHAAIVLMSTRGLDHRGRERLAAYLRRGGGALVAAGPDVDSDVLAELIGAGRVTLVPPTVGGASAPQTLAPGDFRHPVLQGFSGQASLSLAVFRRVSEMRVAGCATLARFTGGQPALVECETGQGRALLFGADLDGRGNNFPRQATFLPLLHEAVRYLAGDRKALDVLVAHAPSGVPPVPGVAPLNPAEQGGPLVAVNIDPSESEPARMTTQRFQQSVERVDTAAPAAAVTLATEREAQQHLWQYLLVAMLVLLLVESVVSMRTA